MHPRPIAPTVGPCLPSLRVFMARDIAAAAGDRQDAVVSAPPGTAASQVPRNDPGDSLLWRACGGPGQELRYSGERPGAATGGALLLMQTACLRRAGGGH